MNNINKQIDKILSKILNRIEKSIDNGNSISSTDVDAFQTFNKCKIESLYYQNIVKKSIDKKH